jgi:hypothetical protein
VPGEPGEYVASRSGNGVNGELALPGGGSLVVFRSSSGIIVALRKNPALEMVMELLDGLVSMSSNRTLYESSSVTGISKNMGGSMLSAGIMLLLTVSSSNSTK